MTGEALSFGRVAAALDRYAGSTVEELAHAVRVGGSCGWVETTGEVPEWTGEDRADRRLAAPVCAACPVQAACLEWQLREGCEVLGVWGPLDEDAFRGVFACWVERRGRHGGGGR